MIALRLVQALVLLAWVFGLFAPSSSRKLVAPAGRWCRERWSTRAGPIDFGPLGVLGVLELAVWWLAYLER